MALLLKGSGVEKGSIFVVFLKKSSDEALNGSVSLNGSPPKGSAAKRRDNVNCSMCSLTTTASYNCSIGVIEYETPREQRADWLNVILHLN